MDDLADLLLFFSKNTSRAASPDPKIQDVMERCLELFALDYTFSVLPNCSGELSSNYPASLVILEAEKDEAANHQPTEIPKLKDLCSRARFARCRARFPIPVILYKKKQVCRSSTLSGGPEMYGRSSFDYFFSGGGSEGGGRRRVDSDQENGTEEGGSEWQLFDRVRSLDIRLLKSFHVSTIVDLMVEKKKVKFGVNVTSSEKVDKENRYAEFDLLCLPYPGCEFFREFREAGYRGEGLVFEWGHGHDAELFVPESAASVCPADYASYRAWDIIELTQRYLALLLGLLADDAGGGLLVHCISGWDRTPLFVSLLRLSLWADGAVHKNLSAQEILYLTLAYDWLLFGHNLEDRLNKGEEILFFCFYFLTYITSDDFSVHNKRIGGGRDESVVEGLLLDGDGSNASGSAWSLQSSTSDDSEGIKENGRNGASCPVPVPIPSNETQCNSSLSIGSWQLVGGGSLRSRDDRLSSSGSPKFSRVCVPEWVEGSLSSCTLLGDDENMVEKHLHLPHITCYSTSPNLEAAGWEIEPRSNSRSNHGRNGTMDQMVTASSPTFEYPSIDPLRYDSSPQIFPTNDDLFVSGMLDSTGTAKEIDHQIDPLHHTFSTERDLIDFHDPLEDSLGESVLLEETRFAKLPNSLDSYPNGEESFTSRRRSRLSAVRSAFYSAYSSRIGVREGGDGEGRARGLGGLIGNFARQVGIRTGGRNS